MRTCRLIVPSRFLKSQHRSGDLVLANDNVTPRPARRSILRSPPLHSCTANHCVAVSEKCGVVDQVERSRFKTHFMSECCLLSRRTVQRVERTCQGMAAFRNARRNVIRGIPASSAISFAVTSFAADTISVSYL